MPATATSFIQVPAELLSAVRRALTNDRPPLEAVTLLREVGFELGGALDAELRARIAAENGGTPADSLDPEAFWRSAGAVFESLGWGRVEHAQPHPGVGSLELVDWLESSAGGGPPGAHISTGIFTDLLGRLAGAPVVVMEVPAGTGRTRLLFGSGETLGALYQSISSGASMDEAIARLG